jgi:hypothetical protein
MRNPFQSNRRKFRVLENKIVFMESALETYFTSPVYVDSDDIGFNGQKIRKMIFNELFKIFSFEAIIETGTFTGNTTGYMAKTTFLPIYSCESSRALSALARKRLFGISNVNCYVMDSRDFLNSLANGEVSKKKVFIYLDAHGYDDLPLKQEIEIICRTWKEFVIMIDDFQVPGDTGYGYDSYVQRQVLSLNTFHPLFLHNGLIPFFPAFPSTEETGAKQGSVILTRKGVLAEQAGGCASLKKCHV